MKYSNLDSYTELFNKLDSCAKNLDEFVGYFHDDNYMFYFNIVDEDEEYVYIDVDVSEMDVYEKGAFNSPFIPINFGVSLLKDYVIEAYPDGILVKYSNDNTEWTDDIIKKEIVSPKKAYEKFKFYLLKERDDYIAEILDFIEHEDNMDVHDGYDDFDDYDDYEDYDDFDDEVICGITVKVPITEFPEESIEEYDLKQDDLIVHFKCQKLDPYSDYSEKPVLRFHDNYAFEYTVNLFELYHINSKAIDVKKQLIDELNSFAKSIINSYVIAIHT